MKKIGTIATTALASALLLVGCSTSGLSSEAKSSADDFVNNYYSDLISAEVDMTAVYTGVDEAMKEALSVADLSEVNASSDYEMYQLIDGIEESKKKALADKLQELNPLSDKYDYSNLTETDRAYSNLIALTSLSQLNGYTDYSFTVSEDKVSFNDEEMKGSVKYSDIEVKYGDEKVTGNEDLEKSFNIVYVNNEWKIDSSEDIETVKENGEASKATEESTAESTDTVEPSEGSTATEETATEE